MNLVLSIFPGIDLLGRAFEEEGFCVVRGPDLLWGGDIHSFHPPPGVFAGVIGGPPCQPFSRLRHLVEHNGYQIRGINLIPEFERVVSEAKPAWWLMENVRDAPIPSVGGYHTRPFLYNNRWIGGTQERLRRFSFGSLADIRIVPEEVIFHNPVKTYTATGPGGQTPGRRDRQPTRSTLSQLCTDQGLPTDFLAQSPLTVSGKYEVVGNGVPLPMGRAIARAVKRALEGVRA